MPDTQPQATVPRETVVRLADSYRELHILQLQQHATMALMIRTCLQRLERQPTSFNDAETRRKIMRERREALDGLRTLAGMLEAKSSGHLTVID